MEFVVFSGNKSFIAGELGNMKDIYSNFRQEKIREAAEC